MKNIKQYFSESAWKKFMESFGDEQIFTLCKEFEELSLDQSRSKLYFEKSILSFFLTNNTGMKSISDIVKAPPLRIRHSEWRKFIKNDLKMRFAFRYDPDSRDNFLKHILNIPRKDDIFKYLKNNLGLSYCSTFLETMVKSVGIESLLVSPRDIIKKHTYLFEILTEYRGYMTRFLILVMLGCGCTVWYRDVLTDNPTQDIFDVFRIRHS